MEGYAMATRYQKESGKATELVGPVANEPRS